MTDGLQSPDGSAKTYIVEVTSPTLGPLETACGVRRRPACLDRSPPTPVGWARCSPLGRESVGQGGQDGFAAEASLVSWSGSERGPCFGGLAHRRLCRRRVHADGGESEWH